MTNEKQINLAPIVLFAYKRLNHTKRTIEALKDNFLAEESSLFIFSDGPKSENEAEKVNQVREYLKSVTGFKDITIIEREKNLGLAGSIISGVTEIVDKYGKIIVLEDDILTSKYFLKYMNDALDLYENEDKVISVSAYTLPVKGVLPETFFLSLADCWGWATWKRGWDLFEADGKKLFNQIKEKRLENKLNIEGADYLQMLEAQINGRADSWAIRWVITAIVNEKLSLYPRQSLTFNIGYDSEGTHCSVEDHSFDTHVLDEMISVRYIPVQQEETAFKKVKSFYNTLDRKSRNNYEKKLRQSVKTILGYILNNIVK